MTPHPFSPLWLAAALITLPALLSAEVVSQEARVAPGRIEVLPGDLGRFRGLCVCGPHADYDAHTGQIVGWIHERTGMPAVRAWEYRRPSERIWYDVNRPATRLPASGELSARRSRTPEAERIYTAYQRLVDEAAGAGDAPLDLHVEIHGHGQRYTAADGTRQRLEVIEAVATGFSDADVWRIRREYERLCAAHGLDAPAPMHFYQTEPYYEHGGVEVNLTWTASGARTTGAMRPECAQRALHFELPGTMRSPAARREVTAAIFADLIAFVWTEMVPRTPSLAATAQGRN